jgi:hypothetical protein
MAIGVSIGIPFNKLSAVNPFPSGTEPTMISALAFSDTRIDITWVDNSTNEDGFRIYISTDNITYSVKGTVGVGVTAYSATGLIANTYYYFEVVAYKGATESGVTGFAGYRTFHTEIGTYINGLTTPLSSAWKISRNTFVNSTKIALGITNLSDHFDLAYDLGGETQECALRNIAKNAHYATLEGTPVFTAGHGFVCSSGNYIKTGYIPSIHAVAMSLNDCSHGAYVDETINTGVVQLMYGVYTEVPATSQIYMMPSYAGVVDSCTNGAFEQEPYAGDEIGLYATVRDSATTTTMYVNATKSDHLSNSVCLPTKEIFIGCRNLDGVENAIFPKRLRFFFIGKKMTQTQMNAFRVALVALFI